MPSDFTCFENKNTVDKPFPYLYGRIVQTIPKTTVCVFVQTINQIARGINRRWLSRSIDEIVGNALGLEVYIGEYLLREKFRVSESSIPFSFRHPTLPKAYFTKRTKSSYA